MGTARGPDDAALAPILYWLGRLYAAQNRVPEAVAASERGLAIREKTLGLEHPMLAELLCDLANLYKRSGRPGCRTPVPTIAGDRGEEPGARAHRRGRLPAESVQLVFGPATLRRGRTALPTIQGNLRETARRKHPKIADVLTILGGLNKAQGRGAEAEQALQRALEIRTEQLGPDHAT